MIAKVVALRDLIQARRWKVEIFTDASGLDLGSNWPSLPMADLATESTLAVAPSELGEETVFYVGLENVEPVTGEPIALERRPPSLIRSRSKVFERGQVLYGRLRPYLRKAFLASPPYDKGICSTEFLVLCTNTNLILPEVLRALLISQAMTQQISRFQVGAALPRISSRDFFSLSLPVPPMEAQETWLRNLATMEAAYRTARNLVSSYPAQLDVSLEALTMGAEMA